MKMYTRFFRTVERKTSPKNEKCIHLKSSQFENVYIMQKKQPKNMTTRRKFDVYILGNFADNSIAAFI